MRGTGGRPVVPVVTLTPAVALLLVSATEVAVTAKFPAAVPAVKRPAVVIVPPVALHVTAVLLLPVTVAVNCFVAPAATVAEVGEIATETVGGALIVIAAVADLVVSATDVAFTWKLPAVVPAVKRPAVETVPPVAVHVTAVLLLPVTVAVNCCVAPASNVAVVGATVTETVGAALTVTAAVADLVISATEVAFTEKLPAVVPAVKRPAVETVPPVAVHVTAVLLLPVTVAVNCCVPPVSTVAVVGATVTETVGAAFTVTAAVADLVVSATEVAFTEKLPAVVPAVKRPAVEIVPPVAVHVTAVLLLPVTVAVNCCVPPVSTVAVVGATVRETVGAEFTVTAAVADLVMSATEVAFTEKLPAVAPAVKRPAVEIVPPVAVHVTAVFVLPVTVAVNCWVPPVRTVAVVGETVTPTGGAPPLITTVNIGRLFAVPVVATGLMVTSVSLFTSRMP